MCVANKHWQDHATAAELFGAHRYLDSQPEPDPLIVCLKEEVDGVLGGGGGGRGGDCGGGGDGLGLGGGGGGECSGGGECGGGECGGGALVALSGLKSLKEVWSVTMMPAQPRVNTRSRIMALLCASLTRRMDRYGPAEKEEGLSSAVSSKGRAPRPKRSCS